MDSGIEQKIFWLKLTIGLYVAKIIYSQWRRNKYLEELLRRKQETTILELNKIVNALIKRFMTEPVPSLRSLVEDTEDTWKLEPSEKRFRLTPRESEPPVSEEDKTPVGPMPIPRKKG